MMEMALLHSEGEATRYTKAKPPEDATFRGLLSFTADYTEAAATYLSSSHLQM